MATETMHMDGTMLAQFIQINFLVECMAVGLLLSGWPNFHYATICFTGTVMMAETLVLSD